MYLHVGNELNIRASDIVGIFDADSATVSAVTKKYLSAQNAKGCVQFASTELPKSFILYRNRKKNDYEICFSQLSTSALLGRVGSFGNFS